MAAIDLRVLIAGVPAGTLRQDGRGLMSFRYDESYRGVPLSLSMPVSNRTYGQDVVRPYLFGLLPDGERQRRAIGREHDVSANNPVALLDHIGLDCPGAVQFVRPERLGEVVTHTGELRELTDHEVALRLKAVRDGGDVSWMGMGERWSLGGNQGKLALAMEGERCHECRGAAPTTHILKNGVAGFRLQALNEYVCMRCAQRCGVAVAQVAYRFFEDEPALVVERYDRVRDATGAVARLHQEDLCQALSVMPDSKYAADGGPSARDVQRLLAGTVHSKLNLLLFSHQLFFNALIGAPDAHAKNYSVLLGLGRNAGLAPMYDVASGLAYERMRRRARLAMSVGGENRVGRVGAGAIRRYAGEGDAELARLLDRAGLTAKSCVALMADLAQEIPVAMEEVFEESSALPGADELRERLLGPVTENCRQTLALL